LTALPVKPIEITMHPALQSSAPSPEPQDGVAASLDLVIGEFSSVSSEIARKGARAFSEMNYADVEALSMEGKSLSEFRERVNALRNDWSAEGPTFSLFAVALPPLPSLIPAPRAQSAPSLVVVPAVPLSPVEVDPPVAPPVTLPVAIVPPPVTPAIKRVTETTASVAAPGKRTRGPHIKLHVRFPDGSVVAESTMYGTFLMTLKRLGVKKVEALGLTVGPMALVGEKPAVPNRGQHKELDGRFVVTHFDTDRSKVLLDQISASLGSNLIVEVK